jgi:hypothetical protein
LKDCLIFLCITYRLKKRIIENIIILFNCMKAKYLFFALVLVLFSGCGPKATDQEVNMQLPVNETAETQEMTNDQDVDVTCEPPAEYACHPVYPGEDDAEDLPPAVCGCTPRCPAGTFLEVGVGEGNNPDGTRKAIFSCK